MVEFEISGAVAQLRLNVGRLNIYTRAVHEKLCRAMLRFLRDDSLHVAILSSAPGQSWSAGDDLREIGLPWGDEPDWSEVLLLLPRDKPVIGAVRGYCLGQGLVHLLRLTDIRLAAPDAQFGFPEIKKGMGGAGVMVGLDEIIPATIARHFALTGEMMNAAAAEHCHLINRVVEESELDAAALALAEQIAANSLSALRAEMSPIGRILGGRDVYRQMAQFNAMWQMFEASRDGKR